MIIQKWRNSGVIREEKGTTWRFNPRNHKRTFDMYVTGQQVKFTKQNVTNQAAILKDPRRLSFFFFFYNTCKEN